ncbi:Hypothetical Protein OBI_RACECAR_230 [Arthrobacter phage Racecar]|nr:hypothetical protein PBI_RACECAR_22 [Arthrobacter phage Racecar]QFG12706.1 hypothetical protein PBI_MIMI_22 [Arthrobacter phage Mimi]
MVNQKRIDRSAEVVKEEAKKSLHYINSHSTSKVMPAVLEADDEILFGDEAVERAAEALEAASEDENASYEDLVRAVVKALRDEDPEPEENK